MATKFYMLYLKNTPQYKTFSKSKSEALGALIEMLTWSNCFDTYFYPTKKELKAYTLKEVKIEPVSSKKSAKTKKS